MNLFGFQLDGLNVEVFLGAMRVAFVIVAILGAALALRGCGPKRTARIIFIVAVAGHALAWFATMYPLENVYGGNTSSDRENHLGWANVVAQGFSPLRTFQVNHLHFEPVWPLLTAIATGFNVERVSLVFQWAPLFVGIALLAAIRFAWLRGGPETPDAGTEAAFAGMGALLLMAVPSDFAGPFRNPWALMFLLKPNHALGLVLVPLAALAISRASNGRSRLFAGFVLQLIGWAFVIHMALFVAGLAIFVALSFAARRSDRMKDLIDAGSAVGVNLLIVSPYLVMLLVAYPFLQSSDTYRLSPFSDRLIDAPLRLGALFLLSAFGAWRSYRGSGRLGRILASQWLGAQIVWQAFPILGLWGLAREQDEAYYWCRFWIGLFAAVGLYRLAREVFERLGRASSRMSPVSIPAALTLILLLPSLLPGWWNPARMDQYFKAGLQPIPAWITEPNLFIRTHTPVDAVFLSDQDYARRVAAFGARRVLVANSLNRPNDYEHRRAIGRAMLVGGPEPMVAEGRERYGLRYVLATSAPMAAAPEITLADLTLKPFLEKVYDKTFPETRVVIFRIRDGNDPS